MDENTEQSAAMKLFELRAALAAAPDAGINVVWTDGEPIEAHFHVTEVGRVQKDFVDCGGTVRSLVSCLLQTWVGDDVDHRITTTKLLKAIDAAALILRGEDLPVELEYEACNVVQLKVVSALVADGVLVLQLGKKNTDCLAKELCVPSSVSASSGCLPGSGCC